MITQQKITMSVLRNTFAGAVLLALGGDGWADNLAGEDELLCVSASVNICLDDGTCVSAEPWELNVPQFITVYLGSQQAQAQTAQRGEEQQQATATQIENFKKAFSVCLEAKDYMVKY